MASVKSVTILLHSSKTMKARPASSPLRVPLLIGKAEELAAYLKTLTPAQLAKVMHISPALAAKTHDLTAAWTPGPVGQTLALDSFAGDIYSGLQADTLSPADRDYADTCLRILSGLYGIIRPFDGICPYRLEMGYRLPNPPYSNLYNFWGDAIAKCLPSGGIIVNTSSVEYTNAVLPYVDQAKVITPQFLTIDPKTGEPTFVVVHAKIARGAFARWLITSRVTDPANFAEFAEIGYVFDRTRSTPASPVFICQEFGGKGLSMRLR